MPRIPLSLTVLGSHGPRAAMTCHYRCGDACSYPEPNTSDNEHIRSVISRSLARRSVLKGALGGCTIDLDGDPGDGFVRAGGAQQPG